MTPRQLGAREVGSLAILQQVLSMPWPCGLASTALSGGYPDVVPRGMLLTLAPWVGSDAIGNPLRTGLLATLLSQRVDDRALLARCRISRKSGSSMHEQ